MKKIKWSFMAIISSMALILTGCENPLLVLNPNGPVAQTQSDTIIFSMLMMAGVLIVVFILYFIILFKYRASKQPKDYEPPHEEGNKYLEALWIAVPVIIVVILSVVTVKTTNQIETTPVGYEDQEPLIIYASSSDWKWHFSYPGEGIETVNYVNIPTDRPVEFRLYSYSAITSFWIPQLGGQKYAMSDMVNKLTFVANNAGSMVGKNANFSGEGFAHMDFEALAMSPTEYVEWVDEVKTNEPELNEKEFQKLLDADYIGRKSYSSTHLSFSPPPEGVNAGHDHDSSKDDQPEQEEDSEEHLLQEDSKTDSHNH